MRVLVVNDDGPEEPALWNLVDALRDHHDVRVYVPSRNYSGAGMSIALESTFEVRRVVPPGERLAAVLAYTVNAPPSQVTCVGCERAFPEAPQLVIAGINLGWNPGEQPYVVSGTAGAARAAVDRGITGVAVSVPYEGRATIPYVAAGVARMVQALHDADALHPAVFINVNVPKTFGPGSTARLTRPSRMTLFEGASVSAGVGDDELTTVELTFGDYAAGEIHPGDEMEALRDGAAAVVVTHARSGLPFNDEPWLSIAAAFGDAVISPLALEGSEHQ